ncbi:MAG: RagB/SusD family nutrient uptake outer membrane protein [Muribaculaceae bacterium]|nr:RagB/SusD family nutrient uptake outer membrane protein [Muribaculaceae bacterium]
MKTIIKSLLAAAVATPLLTGCIEETFPTSSITQGQLEASPEAVAAAVWGMPGSMISLGMSYDTQHYQFGYPAVMHALDCMTDDMAVNYANGYNWFASWCESSRSLGKDYAVCQFVWNTFYDQVLACNKAIGALDPDTEDATERFYYGTALAYRAYVYLEAAQCYETLPTAINAGVSPEGKEILGLTIPIVTEKTTEEECRNNPRATHEQMVEFIESDLIKAFEYLEGTSSPSKLLPDLAVAYGIAARLYLWDAQYDKASEYAQLCISTSGATPLTKDEWLSTTEGFNNSDVSSWLFALQLEPENSAVRTSIINWTSFCSNEADFGYAGAGAMTSIGAAYYERMSDQDFRKLSYIAPESSTLASKVPVINKEWADQYMSEYNSIKIRPGSGQQYEYETAASVGIPLMRVEEMYFIDAECKAHSNPEAGAQALTDFMRKYRYGTFQMYAEDEEEVMDEIIFQKRMEFWGEGRNFYDVKRLNISCTRAYSGSNFDPSSDSFNTEGRAQWMNFVITDQEVQNNKALVGMNNISPANIYSPVKF